MIEFGLGILGGIVAWLGTMVIGQPFYELINLRRETDVRYRRCSMRRGRSALTARPIPLAAEPFDRRQIHPEIGIIAMLSRKPSMWERIVRPSQRRQLGG
jgi:hypothetical protein